MQNMRNIQNQVNDIMDAMDVDDAMLVQPIIDGLQDVNINIIIPRHRNENLALRHNIHVERQHAQRAARDQRRAERDVVFLR